MLGDLLVVLLQEPTPIVQGSGRGGGIGDFFGQIPSEVFIRCGLIALLLVAGIAFFGLRTRGQQQSKRRMDGPAASDQEPNRSEPDDPPDPPAARRSFDTGDLPDLDMLLTSAPAQHEPEVPPTRTARPGVFTVKLHSGKTTEAQEVVSILRDESDGRLIVQMGEMAYRTLLDAPEAKQRFMQVMKELADVVTKPDSHAPESQPPEPQPTVIPAVPEAVKPEATSPQPPALPVSPPPRVVASEGLPGDLPSFKLDDHPVVTTKGSLGRTKFHSGPIPELNIAAAIEAYLQHKLTQSSAFAGREIHVHSAPGGGVRIQVDDTYYDAVGDVADAEVRAFLSATIQEWQDRQ